MTTKIHTYGILDRFLSRNVTALLRENLWLAHRYKNNCTALSKRHRQEYVDYRASMYPEIADLEATEKRTPEQKSRLRELKLSVKADPELQLLSQRQKGEWATQEHAYRSTMHWGQAGLAVMDQASALSSSSGPQFRRFEPTGRVGAQVQIGAQTFVRGNAQKGVVNITDMPWPGATNPNARLARIAVSGPDRTKVWVEFPVVMHRPLPEGKVCFAWILVRRYANRFRYDLQLSVTTDEEVQRPKGDKMVAIDLGWKRDGDNQLRAATAGDHESCHNLLVPAGDKYREIRSIRDKHCESVRLLVHAQRGELEKVSEDVLEHLHHMADPTRARDKQPGKWRSSTALAKLSRLLTHANSCPDYLEAWFHQDRHLWQYEAGTSRRCQARRKDIYRKWARALERQYDYVALENLTVGNLTRRKGSGAPKAPNRQRLVVCPSELIRIVKEVFGEERTILVDPCNTSRTCPECGHVNAGSSSLVLVCTQCGHEGDRDANAVVEIYARGCEGLGSHKSAATARDAKRQEKQRKKKEVSRIKAEARAAKRQFSQIVSQVPGIAQAAE